MVELRKRPPPKEPSTAAPAAKKSRASSSKAKDKAADSSNSVIEQAKTAATKIKEAVVGPTASETDAATTDDAPEAVVETGESGMIPETAGTAPSMTTISTDQSVEASKANLDQVKTASVIGEGTVADNSAQPTATTGDTGATEDADRPSATEDLENPPEKGKVEPATTTSTQDVQATDALLAETPVVPSSSTSETATTPLSTASVGKKIADLSAFGGEIETHTGTKTTLSALLQESPGGIVIFTYPRASTPGCTTQACSFRDNHDSLTGGTGLKIYGLSTDSTKANATFVRRQNLQYELLCDVDAGLTGVLGMKKGPKSTVRGVVVVDGQGVVKVWFQGGPQNTVNAVKEYVASLTE